MPRSKKTTIQNNPLDSIKIIDNPPRKSRKNSPKMSNKALATSTPPSPKETLSEISFHEVSQNTAAHSNKNKALLIVKKWARWSCAAGVITLPFVATPVISSIQINMVGEICKSYKVPFNRESVKAILGSLFASGGTVLALRMVAKELLKNIPLAGTAVVLVTQPTIVYKLTTTIGLIFINHFEKQGDLSNIDLDEAGRHLKVELNQ